MRNKHIGSSFDEFLREEGILDVVEQGAREIGLAIELRKIMRRKRVSEAELARRLKTSQRVVRRVLDPSQSGTRLDSLARLARALGCALDISVRPARKPARRTSARAAKRAA